MNRKHMKKTGIVLLAVSLSAGIGLLVRKGVSSKKRRTEEKRTHDKALSAVVKGIRAHAADFDGLYEGLYQSAQHRGSCSTDAYQEWCDRVGQLEDEPFRIAFQSLFSKADIEDEAFCREQYQQLLDCVLAAGIERDRDSGLTCTADETLRLAYVAADGQKPETGLEYTVVKAAWLSGEKVLEYGLVMTGAPVSGEDSDE